MGQVFYTKGAPDTLAESMSAETAITTTYLSLGSNLGDRMAHLQGAIDRMDEHGQVVAESSVWITEPWGYEDDRAYLNMVCKYHTALSPSVLHTFLKKLEVEAGRTSTRSSSGGYAARELDIDILFYGDQVIESDTLTVPHPRLHLRNFVLQPLAEIAPTLLHPLLRRSIAELLEHSSDQSDPLVRYDRI